MKNKGGGAQQECKIIQKRADQWCKDNGYPIQRRRYWQKRKWTPKEKPDLFKKEQDDLRESYKQSLANKKERE